MSESEMTLAATIARQAVEDRDHARDLAVALESAVAELEALVRRLVAEHHRQYHRYDGGVGWERCDVPICREAREVMGR